MLVTELRCVLPNSLGESLLGEDARFDRCGWFPSLRGVDLWPLWPPRRCAGCWRLRIEAGRVQGQGVRRATRYRCWLPVCPIHLLVSLNAAVFQGDCLEENALQLAPAWLRRRTVERWEVEPEERSGGNSVTTVYYCLSIQLEAAGPLGLLLRPLLPLLSFRLCGSAAHQVAMKWLKRHWQVLLQRHASPAAPAPEKSLGFPSCSPKPCEEPPTPQGRDPSARAANGLSISTDGPGEMDSAQNSPMDAEVLLPSSKGMPFHNGFLYKLGDGILNTTWNLRYFLLIGQTLQYYRSQHEARPRDAINLSGVTVEWLRDQSRPFSFTVSKSGSRSYCLSGCTEQEASEWMERIQAASKINHTSVTTPSSRRPYHGSPSELPELAQPAASTWQEAKMKECSQVLTQALQHRGFRLRELRHGVRILEPAADPPTQKRRWKVRFALHFLMAVLLYCYFGWLWACITLGVFFLAFRPRGEPPLLVAAACLKHSADEIKEALGEHWRFQEWQPQHLHAQALSLLPSRDEVLRLRFRVLGGSRSIELRRRWARSEGNGRLLLSVEELQQGDVREFEGFAIQPLEEGCAVLWLCCFDLLPWVPWAPRIVREELVVRRISALAAFREWLPWSRRTGPKMSMGRMEQRLNTSFSRSGAMLKDSLQLQVLPMLLRPFQRSVRQQGAVLEAPRDAERATLWVDLLMEIGRQALRGGKEVFVVSRPHGVLPQTLLGDFPQRLAARWACVATLCPGPAPEESKERMLRVITFMVSGLHLAAAAFPHLPWLDFACAPGRHSTVLPEDCTAQIDVQDGSGTLRRSSFEVTGAGHHFRLHGNDEVRCCLRFPGGFSFQDTGSTTVEFDPSRRTSTRVRFGMPCLEVRPSRHSLGSGSIFHWTGCSSFSAESGMQCRLNFGVRRGEEDVQGVLRDADGSQVALIHGSWLGPLLCDGEVLWKGPAM